MPNYIKIHRTSNLTTTLWRSLQTLSVTRVFIAGILLILLGLNNHKYIWSIDPDVYRYICLVYITGALVLVALQLRLKKYFFWQLSSQVAFDVVVISVLFYFGGGINSSLVILYLFPLANCAILAPLTWALLLSSLVAIYILLLSTIQFLELGVETAISNSGLYGATFLAMTYAVNRLAHRLINQEELALQHEKNLRIRQEINNLVVADMDDGIIVVDQTSRVHACNPASKKMLGIDIIQGVTKLSSLPHMRPIADAFFSWRNQTTEMKPVMIKGIRHDTVTHLKLRFVIVNDELGEQSDRCVIFLQDASEIENQAQQLKLASMGRLTASIAHEVRNPLSSISYAAGLLGESDLSSEHAARLLKIVNDNVVRLNQLIEDILHLSRKAQIHVEPFLLKPALQEIVQEFQETHALASNIIHLAVPDELMIRFDPQHLREVVVNLLTNASRYASGVAGSIELFVIADSGNHLELHVHDDGPGITAEVRAHLFEPFYTTSSRGTGLGLYMARELCLNNGALLDYEYRITELEAMHGNTQANGRFVITFVKPT